ncbi:hypothetical protein GW17_00043301 [Ensete ventricosum]|nr:hypothetical protein GW17_00043301 [Ensete ventricosum]
MTLRLKQAYQCKEIVSGALRPRVCRLQRPCRAALSVGPAVPSPSLPARHRWKQCLPGNQIRIVFLRSSPTVPIVEGMYRRLSKACRIGVDLPKVQRACSLTCSDDRQRSCLLYATFHLHRDLGFRDV